MKNVIDPQEWLEQIVHCLQEKLQIQNVDWTYDRIALYFKYNWYFTIKTNELLQFLMLGYEPDRVAYELEQEICNMYLRDTIKKVSI